MLNYEKYKDIIRDRIINDNYDSQTSFECIICKLVKGEKWCENNSCDYLAVFDWLYKEATEEIKVTTLVYELLKYFDKKGFQYIACDDNGTITFYEHMPLRENGYWTMADRKGDECILDSHIYEQFTFIAWEDEPMLVKEVLEKCEVVEK